MNERIQELAQQAGLKKDHGSDREYVGDFDWRQFAELIIKECATVQHKRFCEHGDVSWDILMEHFGVES